MSDAPHPHDDAHDDAHERFATSDAILDELDRTELKSLVHSMLWHLRCTDAFWFIQVEKEHGLTEAEDLNAAVWTKMGQMAAKDIVQRFGPFPPGIDGFLAAYRYFPWAILVRFDFERPGPDELTFTVAQCPPQLARRKHGLGPYRCKHMHLGELQAFCAVIDPALRVDCQYAPPDPHPDDHFCKFRISVSAE
ncbi:MAG: DUF6125 family protein [Desulfovibrionaceae bacterium]